jgi:Ni,Fe-hydrogenase III small subunit/ferredoxin
MLSLIWKALRTGCATQDGSRASGSLPDRFRGRPDLDVDACDGCSECVTACPSRVIGVSRSRPDGPPEQLTLDLAGCLFCGDCVPACPRNALRMTQEFELAGRDRDTLVMEAQLAPAAREAGGGSGPRAGPAEPGPQLVRPPAADVGDPYRMDARCARVRAGAPPQPVSWPPIPRVGEALKERIGRLLGRSLHIREVSAGDCNACDLEVQAINNVIFDASRFGIHFVASPRHADMLLVTGPVSRNMAGPLVEAYNACPEPRLVVAVGACACAGGIFAASPQTMAGADRVIPVDMYIPGCPPRPQAILHGLLMTLERAEPKFRKIRLRKRPAGEAAPGAGQPPPA